MKNYGNTKKPLVAKIRRSNKEAYGPNWSALREACFKRDGGKCIKCGSTHNLTADHIIPVAKGGVTALHNLRTLCLDRCHINVTRSKGGRALLRGLSKKLNSKPKASSNSLKDYL